MSHRHTITQKVTLGGQSIWAETTLEGTHQFSFDDVVESGVRDVVLPLLFNAKALVSLFVLSDADLLLTPVGPGGGAPIALRAGVPLEWHCKGYHPLPWFEGRVVEVNVTNPSGQDARLQVEALMAPERDTGKAETKAGPAPTAKK